MFCFCLHSFPIFFFHSKPLKQLSLFLLFKLWLLLRWKHSEGAPFPGRALAAQSWARWGNVKLARVEPELRSRRRARALKNALDARADIQLLHFGRQTSTVIRLVRKRLTKFYFMCLIHWVLTTIGNRLVIGGCGSVGSAVASDTRDPRFESRHWQSFNHQLYIIKDKYKAT